LELKSKSAIHNGGFFFYSPIYLIFVEIKLNNVGVRLSFKGNSSLRTALGRVGSRGMVGEDRMPPAQFNLLQGNPNPNPAPASPIIPLGSGQLPRAPYRKP